MSVSRAPLLALSLLAAAACGSESGGGGTEPPKGPLKIAIMHPPVAMMMMPPPMGGMTPPPMPMGVPALEWALDAINKAGGPAGRPIQLDYFKEIEGDRDGLIATAKQIAADGEHLAVIGPGASESLFLVADAYLQYEKPIISPYSASADIFRAYAGKDFIWRTRQSDIAQVELLIRFAKEQGAAKIALISGLGADAITFFSWFGFFATELGFSPDAVTIAPIAEDAPCAEAVATATTARPDMIFVAVSAPAEADCTGRALAPPPGTTGGPRVVYADTGFDPNALRLLGPPADHLEGFSSAGNDEYGAAFRARYGDIPVEPHGPSEYDALLLLAYGLEISQGKGGADLVAGMKAVVDGHDGGPYGWQEEGVAQAFAELRKGSRPQLVGATGPLVFQRDLYVDLASSTLAHWTMGMRGPVYDRSYFTGDSSFRTSGGELVDADIALASSTDHPSGWTPGAPRSDGWAVVASLSSGWANYRHQADALRQYQTLIASGMPEDHIIFILADDVATARQNPMPGQVLNAPGGPDLHHGITVDYGLGITAEDLSNIITGQISPQTPKVFGGGAGSDLYLYLVGHGGAKGMPIGATTTAEGLAGTGSVFSPELLRRALCTLRSQDRVRRVLTVIESCHAGVFGDAAFGGLEKGCDDIMQPLEGVVLMTAATDRENSFAANYDPAIGAWLADAFSAELTGEFDQGTHDSIAAIYAGVYLRVSGSHVSLYNGANAGSLSTLELGEFFKP